MQRQLSIGTAHDSMTARPDSSHTTASHLTNMQQPVSQSGSHTNTSRQHLRFDDLESHPVSMEADQPGVCSSSEGRPPAERDLLVPRLHPMHVLEGSNAAEQSRHSSGREQQHPGNPALFEPDGEAELPGHRPGRPRHVQPFGQMQSGFGLEQLAVAHTGHAPNVVCDSILRHPLALESAYVAATGTEPVFTSCHDKFCGTVDYIWYSIPQVPRC